MAKTKTRTKKSSRPFRRYTKKYRSSTMGKVFPPLDVRSPKDLKQFEKRLTKGPLTIVLVYADWCEHCHTMMPHFDAASKSPNRSIQSVKVNEQMLNSVNNYINKNVNRSSTPLSVEGYPSIILVDKKGNKVTDIEPVRDTSVMTKVMSQSPKAVNNSVNQSVKNTGVSNANVGISNTGMVGKLGSNSLSPMNADVGENELKGSIQSNNSLKPRMKPDDMLIKNEDMTPNNKTNVNNKANVNNKKNNSNFDLEDSIAPSPLNTFTIPKNTNKEPNFNIPKNIEKTTDQLVNLQGPIEPPSPETDLVSDNLTPAEKIEGGGRKGGSLMSSISQAAYTLATPAALLATATYVMKKPLKKTKKSGKKSGKKTHRRRR